MILAGASTDPADVKPVIDAFRGWTSYTPVWSSSAVQPVLGNSTLTGRYLQTYGLVIAEIRLVIGNSGVTLGTGVYYFTLPLNASADSVNYNAVGVGWALDAGIKESGGVVKIDDATKFRIVTAPETTTGASFGNANPFTFGAADVITARAMYEPA